MQKKPLRFFSLFFAVAILFSVIVSDTYCFQSEQNISNIISSRINSPVDPDDPTNKIVELLKMDKDTEMPIPSAVFTLFTGSGEQIGGRYVTDANGKITVRLGNGDYYFEEVLPGSGYTFDISEDGRITRYPFRVTNDSDSKVVVKAYNIKLSGSLVISKTVQNTDGSPLTDAQRNTLFDFTVTFSDGGTYTYRVDGGEEQPLASGGVLKLSHGQTAVFGSIPAGVMYNVTETPAEGYQVSGNGHSGTVTEHGVAANFINYFGTADMGTLVVTKEVSGEGADFDAEFAFTAVIGGISETFYLKHGESKTFTGLPLGTDYSVFENGAGGDYTPSVSSYGGRITSSETVVLPFVNVYNDTSEDKTGSLEVTKKVIWKNEADESKEFTFEVVFMRDNDRERHTFTLRDGQTKLFDNLPVGTSYVVRETDAAGFLPMLDVESGTISGEHTATVLFRNTEPGETDDPETVKLSVTKRLDGNFTQSDMSRVFAFTLTVNDTVTEFTLKAGQTKVFDVPVGAEYEVREENYFAYGYIQSISNGTGTVGASDIRVIALNRVSDTYQPTITITGEKTWKLGDYTDVVLPESITVQLKNSGIVVLSRTVTPDVDGKWLYSFTVPEFNEDGSKAHYTVDELPVPGYKASFRGYDIINTYIGTAVTDTLIIKKEIVGSDAPEAEFEFAFIGQNGAPMPEGAVKSTLKIAVVGAGEAEIGGITYTAAGEYIYTVHEINGGDENWIYDTQYYKVTVTVTEKDGKLVAERVITKNDAVCGEIIFTNTYENHVTEEIIITGTKTWNHGDNPEDRRPKSVVVYLYGDGELVRQKQITADDEWKYSFVMPKYASDGHEIIYHIDEAGIPDYDKTVTGYDILNTYTGSPGRPPATADTPTVVLLSAVMLMSLAGIVGIAVSAKRRKGRE